MLGAPDPRAVRYDGTSPNAVEVNADVFPRVRCDAIPKVYPPTIAFFAILILHAAV
jgi:hypothetical protein